MKQSRKAWKTQVNEMADFQSFLTRLGSAPVHKYICHCYDENDIVNAILQQQTPQEKDASNTEKELLRDALVNGNNAVVLVGPEGDFSVEEVIRAEMSGFLPVSLGDSRLRTETAALVAVHLMRLFA